MEKIIEAIRPLYKDFLLFLERVKKPTRTRVHIHRASDGTIYVSNSTIAGPISVTSPGKVVIKSCQVITTGTGVKLNNLKGFDFSDVNEFAQTHHSQYAKGKVSESIGVPHWTE